MAERVGFELAFAGCLPEARSILRDAIEFVAHAHTMLRDPALQVTWLNKNEAENAFKNAFERHKAEGIFKGIEELHQTWGQMSETGSHATINAISDRFGITETDKAFEWRLNYCGAEPDVWDKSLFTMLQTVSAMEQILFADYESRLHLDDGLSRMRSKFDGMKGHLRQTLIDRYNLKPPSGPTIFP